MEETQKKAIESLAKLLPDIYKDLAQPSVQALGKALGNTVRFCTLPFTALGTLDDMAKANLTHHLEEYKKKLEKISVEKITEVPPQLGVPVLLKLSYTTNEEIAQLYTSLLATASNQDTADKAHPGFESIISQLSPDEARIIQYLNNHPYIEYAELKGYPVDVSGYDTYFERSTLIPYRVKLDFKENIKAYFANLIRLGILVDMLSVFKMHSKDYELIREKYNFRLIEECVPKIFKNVIPVKSYYDVTPFGSMFIKACTGNNTEE